MSLNCFLLNQLTDPQTLPSPLQSFQLTAHSILAANGRLWSVYSTCWTGSLPRVRCVNSLRIVLSVLFITLYNLIGNETCEKLFFKWKLVKQLLKDSKSSHWREGKKTKTKLLWKCGRTSVKDEGRNVNTWKILFSECFPSTFKSSFHWKETATRNLRPYITDRFCAKDVTRLPSTELY